MRKIPPPYSDPTPLFRHGGALPTFTNSMPLFPHRKTQPGDAGRWLDFSASINPLGTPKSVLKAIRSALPSVALYPDPYATDLALEILIVGHGLNTEEAGIVMGNGSNDLIYAIARAFRPRRVAIAEPTYTEYLRASQLVGAEVDHWLADAEDNFELRPFDVKGIDLVWLCHPNNPTGRLWPRADVGKWISRNPKTLFVADEAFLWMAVPTDDSGSPARSLDGAPDAANLITLNSLTKAFALPGLRLGYAMACPKVAQKIQNELPPWSVNILAQRAGEAVLAEAMYREKTHTWRNSAATRSFGRDLAAVSPRLRVFPSSANFVLARVEGMTAKELADRLIQRGIVIRDASNFVGLDEHYFRVAIRTPPDNERLFTELRSILGE